MTAWPGETLRLDFDPAEHPRGWHGRWAKTGGSESKAAGDYLTGLRGKVTPKELRSWEEASAHKQTTMDPAYHYTPAQRAAISAYTETGYQDINDAARTGRGAVAQADELSGAMQPFPADLVLLRELKGADALSNVQPGDVLTDPGFSSTALSPGGRFASNRHDTTIMHILTPKGTPSVWADPASGFPEHEVILDRGQPMVVMKRSAAQPGREGSVSEIWLLALPKASR